MDNGSFSYPVEYSKPWLSTADQVQLLQSRGLVVDDCEQAEKFLRHLNYYRFSGYCLAFESSRHCFSEGATFAKVQGSYYFDVELRDLLTEALEVIEVDCRSTIAYTFGRMKGAFGHLRSDNFRKTKTFDHSAWLIHVTKESKRSKELFVEHFKKRYTSFPDLPCWIATEVMTFGTVSKMYEGVRNDVQTEIARHYGFQGSDLASALHHLSYVRNICAHHGRLWDRSWAIKQKIPSGNYWRPPLVPYSNRLFMTMLLVNRLLKKCITCEAFAVDWRRRVNELMKMPPEAEGALIKMGMPENWYQHPYWV